MSPLAWRMAMDMWRLQLEMTRLAFGAPFVISMRMAKAAQDAGKPGFLTDPEWQRMVNEKVAAGWDAQRVLTTHWWRVGAQAGDPKVARHALSPFRRRVDANVKRLAR